MVSEQRHCFLNPSPCTCTQVKEEDVFWKSLVQAGRRQVQEGGGQEAEMARPPPAQTGRWGHAGPDKPQKGTRGVSGPSSRKYSGRDAGGHMLL